MSSPQPKSPQPKPKKQRVASTATTDSVAGRKSSSSSTTASGPLQCAVCSRQFSRPSHHDRHYRTHLPPEGRLALPCNRCGKTFGRNDVLLRHLRTAHGVDPGPQPKAAQKSCYRCVHLRRKCDRAQPCRLCAAGGAVCQYPHTELSVTQQAINQAQGQAQTQVQAPAPGPAPAPTTVPPPSYPTQTNDLSPLAHTPIVLTSDNTPPLFHGDSNGNVDGGYHHHQTDFGGGMPGVDVNVLNVANGVPPNDGTAPYGGVTANGCSPSFSDEYYLAADTTPFVASLSAAGQLDFRTAGLDWLDFDVPDIFSTADGTGMDIEPSLASQPAQHTPQHTPQPFHSQTPQYQPQSQTHGPPPTQHQQQHAPPPPPPPAPHAQQQHQHPMDRPPSSQYVNYAVNPVASHGHAATAPHVGGPGNGPSASSTSVLPWPFDDTAHDLAPHRYSLPPLREVLQNTLMQSTNSTPPNKSVLANLVALMSDTRMSQAGDGGEETDESGNVHLKQQANGTAGVNNNTTPMAMSISTMDPGMAHAANLLKRLVDTYVSKFQPILPLLHVPTWDLGTCPPVLVSAMACVGSLLSDDERVASLTWSISDICMPMIAWLGSSDSANYRDIAYLSALCVHQIYSLGSGNRQLYQNADRTRGILVGGLRGMGCLTTRLSLEDKLEQEQNSSININGSGGGSTATTHPSTPTLPVDPATQHEQWMAWVRREREKRTAWSSFEYDCSLCTLTGRRGAVDLSELPSRLPCAETLWDAPSATAWAALKTRLHPDAQGAPVSLVLKAALSQDDSEDVMGNDDDAEHDHDSHRCEDDSDMSEGGSGTYVGTDRDTPRISTGASTTIVGSTTTTTMPSSTTSPQVSFWGKRLCAQVIGRLLWDLKQLETLSSSEYFGMPSLSTAHAASKVRLLRALDNLLVSMDQPATVADLISYNIASLIGHYSHLYTAQDVLDIILYIVRNTVAHGARKLQFHKGIQMAKRRLVATLSRDPQEARRLVYHAAQIVAVANDYLVSAPCEILRLFMGYTFLIVFAAYCPNSHRFQIPGPQQQQQPLQPAAPLPFGSATAMPSLSSPLPPSTMLPPPPTTPTSVIQLDIPSHRIASPSDVDNWIAHGGPAAIGSVPNLFAEGGALAISRDAQAMLQRLKCWGLAEKFTKILQSFEATVLVGQSQVSGQAQAQAQSQMQG
ncbi:hypothetical protein SBRCBS47491_007466 [Sporothrix bragantina]|uniref:Uncharacterized protein n=1 Tax=Sporothrix bragantina TaxID=671064 RepID=A0ABP0CDF8_9PEZI